MYCPNCGKEITDNNAWYCPHCGKTTKDSNLISENAIKSKDSSGFHWRKALFIICAICALTGGILLILGFSVWSEFSDISYWFNYGGGIFVCCALVFIGLITGIIGLCCKK